MKHMKKYEELLDFDFEKEKEEEDLNLSEAFEKYIKGQKIHSEVFNVTPEGTWTEYSGIRCENGYQYVSHGGGCSGEDCNETMIVDPDNNIVASWNW